MLQNVIKCYGMEWNVIEQNGMLWNGVECYEMEWNVMELNAME